MSEAVQGKLYAIGLGPGDPDLLTVKAQRLLGEVDLVFVPVRQDRDSLSRRIIDRLVDASRLRELSFTMAHSTEENRPRWRQHAAELARAVSDGQSAAFVTEGDPLLYSTFIHLYRELSSGWPSVQVEIVPGVSSITAAAAVAGLPLADDRQRIAIVPAAGEVMHALATFDTVVVIKISMALEAVLKALDVTGRIDEAVYVERASWPEECVVTDVRNLRKRKPDYFGQIVVTRR